MKPMIIFVRVFAILVCVMSVWSCKEEIVHKGKTPLLSVGNDFLYREDVSRFYAANPPKGDSVQFVNEFINRWIEETLFYNVALRNISSSTEIDKLVDSYKRSLVLNLYQDGLVEQQLKKSISDEEVHAFYDSNPALFEIEEPLVRGLFLKVPKDAPKISSLRSWCRGRTIDDLEKLDKYSLVNNVQYEYFAESWCRVADIAAKTPVTESDLLQRLSRNTDIEFKDNDFVYFVAVDSMIGKGGLKPVELVETEIRELLVNTLKANFIKEKKQNLYNEALRNGAIKHYDE